MAKTKYGHHIFTNFKPEELGGDGKRAKYTVVLDAKGGEKFKGKDFSIAACLIKEPGIMVPDTHTHEFDQFLVFIGSNPLAESLGGEAEICLGKEQEKHVIKNKTIVHIPGGLEHCPLTHKKVGKPYLFLDIILASEYKSNLSK
jgi:hypothetical protein